MYTKAHACVYTCHSNPPVTCFTRMVITFYWLTKMYLSSRYHGSCLVTEVISPESGHYSALCQSKLEVNRQYFVFFTKRKHVGFLVILRLLHITSSQGCPGFSCDMQAVMEQQTIIHGAVRQLSVPPKVPGMTGAQ